MKHGLRLFSCVAVALLSCSCTSGMKAALGLQRSSPDEFKVVNLAPLTVPPDYNLRPPRPGELRAEDVFTNQTAQKALFGTLNISEASQAEILLAQRASQAGVNPDIRALIDGEVAAVIRKSRKLSDRVMFWKSDEASSQISNSAGSDKVGDPINAQTESERIRKIIGDESVQVTRVKTSKGKLPGL